MAIIAALEMERSMAQKQVSLKHTIKWMPNPSLIMKPSTVIKVQSDSMIIQEKQKAVDICGTQEDCPIPLDDYKLKFRKRIVMT